MPEFEITYASRAFAIIGERSRGDNGAQRDMLIELVRHSGVSLYVIAGAELGRERISPEDRARVAAALAVTEAECWDRLVTIPAPGRPPTARDRQPRA